MTIKIMYHDKELEAMDLERHGDWIDVRAAEDVKAYAGDFKIISLGFSAQLPKGYEAHLAPRSSTFKKWGIVQTNSVGIIDEAYCGENDVWGFPAYFTRDTEIHKGDRIGQFRLVEKMDNVDFEHVDHLDAKSRGGFGSTGTN